MRCLFFLLAACGAQAQITNGDSTRAQAIIGGATDTADNAVFILQLTYDNGADYFCSAALIGERTLLTAAHCLDPGTANATRVTIVASNAATEPEISAANTYQVVTSLIHPAWDPSTLDNDLGLVLLDHAPSVAALPLNTTAIDALQGASVRVIGYGVSAASGTGGGVRRTATFPVTTVAAQSLTLDESSGTAVCGGDSGAPVLYAFGATERVVAVVSHGNSDCDVDSVATRADAYADFIDDWLTTTDVALCTADGSCAPGCTPADPDCKANRAACTANNQCSGGVCTVEAGYATPYCSQACATSSECPSEMQCAAVGACQLMAQTTGTSAGAGASSGSTSGAAAALTTTSQKKGCAASTPTDSVAVLLFLFWRRQRQISRATSTRCSPSLVPSTRAT